MLHFEYKSCIPLFPFFPLKRQILYSGYTIPDKSKWNKPRSPFQCWLKMADGWVAQHCRGEEGMHQIFSFCSICFVGDCRSDCTNLVFSMEECPFKKRMKSREVHFHIICRKGCKCSCGVGAGNAFCSCLPRQYVLFVYKI